MEGKQKSRLKVLPIVVSICATFVLIAGVGGWVYVQKQQVAEKSKEFQQAQEAAQKQQAESLKQLKYQECETDQRAAEQAHDVMYVYQNCELKL